MMASFRAFAARRLHMPRSATNTLTTQSTAERATVEFGASGRFATCASSPEVTAWCQGLTPAERRSLGRSSSRRPLAVMARFVEPGEGVEGDDLPSDFY